MTDEQIGIMDAIAWLVVAIGSGVAVVLVLAVVYTGRPQGVEAQHTDFRSYFVVGVVMLLLGIGLTIALLTVFEASWVIGLPLVSVGLVFVSIGAGNRDKWSHR